MSNKRRIYAKGRIEGSFTGYRHEVEDSPAWKTMNPSARVLYMALLRRLSFKAYNNGKVYLSCRKAAELLGLSLRSIPMLFHEIEHFGFITTTTPGRGKRQSPKFLCSKKC